MDTMDTLKHFAVIDCAVDTPTLHHTLQRHMAFADLRALCLFAHQREADLAHVGPWLIELPDRVTHECLAWLRQVENHHPAISWLVTQVDFQTLFAHLQSQLDLRLPDGSHSLQRFWDPRAWSRLQRVLTIPQRITFMGPLLEWKVTFNNKTHQVIRIETEDAEDTLQEKISHVDTHL